MPRYPRRYRKFGKAALTRRRSRFAARYAGRLNRKFVLGGLGRRVGYGASRVGAGLLAIDAMRAARGAYKRYQRRSAPSSKRSSQVSGEWLGTLPAIAPEVINWNTLNTYPLVDMERGTGIRERISGRVFIKGFKLCMHVLNKNQIPITVHWAIIQEKVQQVQPLNTNFFRDTALTTDRTLDFTDRTGTGDVYDMRKLCNPINTSRYNVITHRRFNLLNKPTTIAETQTLSWQKKIMTYIPIKRRVTYETSTSEFNERPWYLAIWWLPVDYAVYNNGVNTLDFWFKKDIYYSDGRM